MKKLFVSTKWLVAVLALGIFAANSDAQAPAPAKTQAATKKPAITAKRTTHMSFDPALLHPSTLTAKAPETFDVNFSTTAGDFTVKVTRAWAPLGADRFYNLVKHHFFDNASFFRVMPGFIVQFGLSAYPQVSGVWQNANIKDDPVTQSNAPATLTFATAGPGTRTTQLFINYGNNASLDKQGFSPFGVVSEGMDSVKKINSQYGEQPDQGMISSKGKAYLDQSFPKLDYIKSATLVGAAAAPAAHHKTAAPAAHPKPASKP